MAVATAALAVELIPLDQIQASRNLRETLPDIPQLAESIFFGWAMVQALSSHGITELTLPVGQLAIYIVLAGLIGVLAAVRPARRAARMDVLAAISYEQVGARSR